MSNPVTNYLAEGAELGAIPDLLEGLRRLAILRTHLRFPGPNAVRPFSQERGGPGIACDLPEEKMEPGLDWDRKSVV